MSASVVVQTHSLSSVIVADLNKMEAAIPAGPASSGRHIFEGHQLRGLGLGLHFNNERGLFVAEFHSASCLNKLLRRVPPTMYSSAHPLNPLVRRLACLGVPENPPQAYLPKHY